MSNDTGNSTPNPSKVAAPMPQLKRRGIRGYFTDLRLEMKKVNWPTRKEAMRLTGVVLVVCTGSILILYGLGMFFGWALESLFKARF
jgi:preprotein translocase subunit SecE